MKTEQEWIDQDEEEQLKKIDVVDLVRYSGDGHLEEDNERSKKVVVLSHSED